MNDLRYYTMPKNDKKEWLDDVNANSKIWNDKVKMLKDSKEMARLKRTNKLPIFGDFDKDKIPNAFDRQPFKKDKKSKWSILQ